MNLLKALHSELRLRPMATSMTLAAVFCGVCALILGEHASRAFTIIGGQNGGALIARVMGALLAAGGTTTIVGTIRRRSIVEIAGLSLVSAGAFIYAAGVLIGLGSNGLIAGGLSTGLWFGTALRVVLQPRTISRLADDG